MKGKKKEKWYVGTFPCILKRETHDILSGDLRMEVFSTNDLRKCWRRYAVYQGPFNTKKQALEIIGPEQLEYQRKRKRRSKNELD